MAEEFQTVHDRHVPVEQDRLGQTALADFERLLAVLGFHDLEIQSFQDPPRDFAGDAGVIDDEASLHWQVFIGRSTWRSSLDLNSTYAAGAALCSKRSLGHDFEDAIDIEDDHELAVETVNAAGELGHAGIEVDGVFLATVVGQRQHLADLIDQQAIGFAAQVDTDRHRRLAVLVFGQAQPRAHVHDSDDAAAQIEHARDLARR